MEIEAGQHDADFRVDNGGIAGGDLAEVVWRYVASVGGICAANEGDVFSVEFLFDARFTKDEDFLFILGQGEDAGNVD